MLREEEVGPDVLQFHYLALLNVVFDLSWAGSFPHSSEDVRSPLVRPDGLQHVLGAVEAGEENQVLLLHADDVLLQSVQHQDPDSGQGQEDASKDTAEYVENHEGCQAGHVDVLHSVEPEHSDTDEGQAAVDLLTGKRVPAVEGQCEEDDEECEGGDSDDYMYDREYPDSSERIPPL